MIYIETITHKGKKFLKWEHKPAYLCIGCCFNDAPKYYNSIDDNYCDQINVGKDCENVIYTDVPLKQILKDL